MTGSMILASSTTGSLILGLIVTVLGGVCVVEALILATLAALKPPPGQAAFPWQPITGFIDAVRKLLAEFAKLSQPIQFLLIGVVLLGGGAYLLDQRPF
jgi:uncharacterized membrane protein YczE